MEEPGRAEVVEIPTRLPAHEASGDGTDFLKAFRSARDGTIKVLRKVPAVAETVASMGNGKRYTIEWPDGIEKAVKSGAATWRPRGDGTFPAVIRDADEKSILKHLRLREADLPPEMWQGLGQLATQNALAALSDKLEEMDLKLEELRRGARDDRFGLVDSGIHQYEQARDAIDPERKSRMLENALQSLLDGRGQLLRVLSSETRELMPPTAWQQIVKAVFFVTGPTEKLGNRVADLTKTLDGAVLATRYAIVIHGELAEPLMARTAVRQLADAIKPAASKMVHLARHSPRRIVDRAEERWTALNDRLLPAASRGDAMLSALLDGKAARMETRGGRDREGR